jgi:integrase/recombinase XerD
MEIYLAEEMYYKYLSQNKTKNTIKAEQQILKWFFFFTSLQGKTHIEEIQYADVLHYLSEARNNQRYWGHNYLAQWNFTLRKFFRVMKRMGLLDWDCDLIQIPHKIRKKPKVATTKEVQTLLATMKSGPLKPVQYRNYIILLFFIETGIRRQELLDIQVEDVNLEENKILIKNSKAKIEPTDYVYISKKLMSALKKYLLIQKKYDRNKQGWLFLNMSTKHYELLGNQLTGKAIANIFTTNCHKAGLDRVIQPHSIRHFFGRELVAKGASYREIMEALRHTDSRSAIVYTSADDRRKKIIYDKYRFEF